MLGVIHPSSLTVRDDLTSLGRAAGRPAEAITPRGELGRMEESRPGPVNQLAASPATVSGTPPNSPTGVSWPPWPTAQPNSFCASAWIAYR
jgi:hypothetical protein